MASIEKRKKALSVSPLKASQTMGASLAFLGLQRSIPLMHGSQGCTAFGIVFFVRHFREPVPLQTTAMDQVSSVMGADDNIVEALRAIADKHHPDVIGLVSTGLAETQGCDLHGGVRAFREQYPDYESTQVVAVNTPDFSGSFESGYAAALKAIVEKLVPDTREQPRFGLRKKQVNVLCGAHLTPGDLEYISETLELFGLRGLLIPDLSGSLDGHLNDEPYSPITTGGTGVADVATAGESVATLVIGASLAGAAAALRERTGVPDHRFDHLLGLNANDRWLMTLAEISGQPVPPRFARQRSQLQDALLDTHFMIGDRRAAIAADPDLVITFDALLSSVGARTVAAVVPARAPALKSLPLESVKVGDLEDLEHLAREQGADILLGNSHATESAQRLGLPLLRVGFPQYDLLGGYQRCWSGYRGTRQALFDLANLLHAPHEQIAPYHSIYSQKPLSEREAVGTAAVVRHG